MALDKILHEHGEALARHEVRHEEHTRRLDSHEEEHDKLWKYKVNVDRYIWVERAVIAAIGALVLWAFQLLTRVVP